MIYSIKGCFESLALSLVVIMINFHFKYRVLRMEFHLTDQLSRSFSWSWWDWARVFTRRYFFPPL